MTSQGGGVAPMYVGVDVGTTSARAGLFTQSGRLVASATQAIDVLEPQPNMYEQSSDNIWEACCHVVKTVVGIIPSSQIHGIGFDATCSLVVLDSAHKPLTVSPTELNRWNVIMWMDHRAEQEAKIINETKHEVLKFTGGSVSLEMQMPKLLWLKKNMCKRCWNKAGHFLDLPDFLTWRCTGSLSRSLCSLVCKWNYHVDGSKEMSWNKDFLTSIGLDDLMQNSYAKIGSGGQAPGSPCGSGLTPEAAAQLGLEPNTPVATSIIDAHAGGLGTLGCQVAEVPDIPLASRLALVCGTSTCHICVNEEALFVPGVWGPYFSAMVPGLWMAEGGQSTTGKLLDHILQTHPAYEWAKDDADYRNILVTDVLWEVLEGLRKDASFQDVCYLTKSLHIWPDFHGNRSPLADSHLQGMICGLSLDKGVESLAKLYLATIQALAYGTRHILEVLQKHGHNTNRLYACGGLSKNNLFIQTHADITGLPVVIPHTKEPVLLGSAMLGACASQDIADLQTAMKLMGGKGIMISPNCSTKQYHDKKYIVFHKLRETQQDYMKIMATE